MGEKRQSSISSEATAVRVCIFIRCCMCHKWRIRSNDSALCKQRDHAFTPQQISDKTTSGRHAVIIMDGAGWHGEELAEDFKNLSIIKLPPYSPELNPIEQVWSWLRQHHLANRCFNGYEAIVDAVSDAWNDFVSDSKRVMKMCTRDWMNMTI